MQTQRRLFAILSAAVLALGVGLSGCSPSTPADDPSGAAPPTPVATEPPRESVTPPSRGPTPSTEPGEPGVEVTKDPSIQPTRAVVTKGAVAYARNVLGYPGPIAKRIANCVVDKGYDKWSVNTLVALADADIAGIDESETVEVTKATQQCVRQFS